MSGVRNPCCFYQHNGHLYIPDLGARLTVLDEHSHRNERTLVVSSYTPEWAHTALAELLPGVEVDWVGKTPREITVTAKSDVKSRFPAPQVGCFSTISGRVSVIRCS